MLRNPLMADAPAESPLRRGFHVAVLLGCLLFAGGCDAPSTFLRDNPLDPTHREYTPQPPDGLLVEPLGESVKLSWNANSVTEEAYIVERAEAGTSAFEEIAVLSPGSSSYRDTDLEWGTYRYRIRGVYSDGNLYTAESDPVGMEHWLHAGSANTRVRNPVTLVDGRVFGYGEGSAAVFDPAAYSWTSVAAPPCSDGRSKATPLQDGGVLVTGIESNSTRACAGIAGADLSTWTRIDIPALPLSVRDRLNAITLDAGRVLAVFHVFESPYWFMKAFYIDAAQGTVTPAAHPITHVSRHDRTPDPLLIGLPDGDIFVINSVDAAYALHTVEDRWVEWTHARPYHEVGLAAVLPGNRLLVVDTGTSGSVSSIIDLTDGSFEIIRGEGSALWYPRFLTVAEGMAYALTNELLRLDPHAMQWMNHPASAPRNLVAGTSLADGRLIFLNDEGRAFVFRER